jgi:hypothetical protein
MAVFKDCNGREHHLRLTLGAVKRLKETHKVDLGKLIDTDAIQRIQEISGDPDQLASIVYAILQPADVTYEKFIDGLDGDALELMQLAFMESFSDFCPSRLRGPLRTLAEKTKELETAAATKAQRKLESISCENLIDSAESSDSTPQI